MTTTTSSELSTAPSVTDLVSDFAGGSASEVTHMIGIGLVKESDAVFFQYQDKGTEPVALLLASGRPLTTLRNVTLAGISIAENVGEFGAIKLNVILQSSQGHNVLVTSGLTTIWSQCVLNGLMALFNGGYLTCPFNLDTWKGNSKMKPCFASVKVNNVGMKDNDLYEQLREARTDGNKRLVETIMRDSVSILNHALTGGPINEVVVDTEQQDVEAAF